MSETDGAHLWFTFTMNTVTMAAEAALELAVEAVTRCGLRERLHALVTEVWQANLDRYEPEELGDDPQTLGNTCARNIANRAEGLVLGNREREVEPWDIAGLGATRPHGALRLDHAGRHFHIMKAPMRHGRRPEWARFDPWTRSSEVREDAARENTVALHGYRTAAPGQDPLPAMTLPFVSAGLEVHLPHFVFVWAADIDSPGTSGWLGAPSLGEQPFVAVQPLWSDPDDYVPVGRRRDFPTGPSFDQRSTAAPPLALKPRREQEGKA